jgi:hypothetical protein
LKVLKAFNKLFNSTKKRGNFPLALEKKIRKFPRLEPKESDL